MRDTAPLMILIAGPYRSGTGDDPAKLADNVRAMEAYTFQSADLMVETARAHGLAVFHALDEVPGCAAARPSGRNF